MSQPRRQYMLNQNEVKSLQRASRHGKDAAFAFWKRMGKKYGFNWQTVKPILGSALGHVTAEVDPTAPRVGDLRDHAGRREKWTGDSWQDLGPVSSPLVRAEDSDTSHEAAGVIEVALSGIRGEVEAFARERGAEGFTDHDLNLHFTPESESSYRKRRTELTQANIIVDSGRRKQLPHGGHVMIWIHRDFVNAGKLV